MIQVLLGLSLIILYCLKIPTVLASTPPVQLSPSDNSSVSSSTLSWQTPEYPLFSTNPYRVQVDEESSFADPFRDYTTANTNYSPQISNGIWHWRIKAKNDQGEWSDWSSIWQFTLTDATPSPQATPTPSAEPTPTASPSSAATSSPNASATPATEFTLSSTPLETDSSQSFSANIILKLSNNPSTTFYLKGAFLKSGSSNYFGQTKVSSSWVKNSASYSEQKQITTDSSSFWTGSLEFMADAKDSGFTGSGDYIFKVARYSSSGSGPTWSNQVTIYIKEKEDEDEPTGGTSTTSSPIPKSSVSTNTSNPQNIKDSLAKSSENSQIDYKIATVAGITLKTTSTPSANLTQVANTGFNYYFFAAGILTLLAGGGSIVYITKKDLIIAMLKKLKSPTDEIHN